MLQRLAVGTPAVAGAAAGLDPGTANFEVTVTADPSELRPFVGSDSSLITITVEDRNTGQPPPTGTVITVTTTLGSFDPINPSVRTVFSQLINGVATESLFAFSTFDTGIALVRASLGDSVGQARVNIRTGSSMAISAVQPNTGSPQGGETVEIRGTGFIEPVRVIFGNAAASILSVTENRIRVVTPASTVPVPAGTTRAVSVQVTAALNEPTEVSDQLLNAFTYVPGGGGIPNQPLIFSVTPASGPNEGGTVVTINGSGFDAPVQVLFGTGNAGQFNGVEATIRSIGPNRIEVIAPSATGFGQDNQNDVVDILVKNLDTGISTVLASAFKYGSDLIITALQPNEIDFDSQDVVTIFGQGFDAPVDVNIAGIQASVISVSGTQIVARAGVPFVENCQSITGSVQVTNIETGETDTTSIGNPQIEDFIYRVLPPTVTGLSPTSGSGSGGTAVTISGVGFDDPVRVLFGDAAGSVTSVSAAGTSISVITPSFSDFDEEECDDDGDGQQGMRFVPTSVDVTVTNLITTCDDEFTGAFTYTPDDSSCRGDAAPLPPTVPECSDGDDNDGDGLSDHASVNPINPDPDCSGPNDDDESM